MKSTYFALFILVVMFAMAVMFYQDLLNQFQMNLGLLICTLVWFGGLAILDFVEKSNKIKNRKI